MKCVIIRNYALGMVGVDSSRRFFQLKFPKVPSLLKFVKLPLSTIRQTALSSPLPSNKFFFFASLFFILKNFITFSVLLLLTVNTGNFCSLSQETPEFGTDSCVTCCTRGVLKLRTIKGIDVVFLRFHSIPEHYGRLRLFAILTSEIF